MSMDSEREAKRQAWLDEEVEVQQVNVLPFGSEGWKIGVWIRGDFCFERVGFETTSLCWPVTRRELKSAGFTQV